MATGLPLCQPVCPSISAFALARRATRLRAPAPARLRQSWYDVFAGPVICARERLPARALFFAGLHIGSVACSRQPLSARATLESVCAYDDGRSSGLRSMLRAYEVTGVCEKNAHRASASVMLIDPRAPDISVASLTKGVWGAAKKTPISAQSKSLFNWPTLTLGVRGACLVAC